MTVTTQTNTLLLERPTVIIVSAKTWIVAQKEMVSIIFKSFCINYFYNIIAIFIEGAPCICAMISTNNMNFPIQLFQAFKSIFIVAEHHITQMIHNIIRANHRIPICDNCFIVVMDISEPSWPEQKFSVMANRNEYRMLKKYYSFL